MTNIWLWATKYSHQHLYREFGLNLLHWIKTVEHFNNIITVVCRKPKPHLNKCHMTGHKVPHIHHESRMQSVASCRLEWCNTSPCRLGHSKRLFSYHCLAIKKYFSTALFYLWIWWRFINCVPLNHLSKFNSTYNNKLDKPCPATSGQPFYVLHNFLAVLDSE